VLNHAAIANNLYRKNPIHLKDRYSKIHISEKSYSEDAMNDDNSTAPFFLQSIIPHVGTEVTGDKFFWRKALEAEFDSAMTRTNGAKLFGLRRTGKSSEAAACCQRLRDAGYVVIKEDAQGKGSEVELLQAILKQLPAKGMKERVTQFITDDNSISKVAREWLNKSTGGKPDDALAYFGPIMAAIENALDENEKVALVIDEFPWLCRSILQSDEKAGKARVDVLLAALRRWRTKGIRMLLMGSIGMVALGREYDLDLSHLNDLSTLGVPTFTPDEAQALVNALAVGGEVHDWTADHTAALLDETVAFYPAMLQKGFEQTTLGGVAAQLDRFPDLFAEKVRPDFDSAYYQQFDKRLKHYAKLPGVLPGLLESLLQTILKAKTPVDWDVLAETSQATNADLGDVLQILHEDGFLAIREGRAGQQWRPASGLVIAWWQRRRGGSKR
jgi:hypothetical protein